MPLKREIRMNQKLYITDQRDELSRFSHFRLTVRIPLLISRNLQYRTTLAYTYVAVIQIVQIGLRYRPDRSKSK